jgi:hypothetical protein
LRNCHCFPKWLYHFIFPPAVSGDVNFTTCSPGWCCFSDLSHTSRHEVELTMILILISLLIKDVEHLFMSLGTICMFSVGKCLLRSFVPLKNWVICIFIVLYLRFQYQYHRFHSILPLSSFLYCDFIFNSENAGSQYVPYIGSILVHTK